MGEKVLIINRSKNAAKLNCPTEGPYEILKVYANGTVKIKRGAYDEIISIRRLQPYKEKNVSATSTEETKTWGRMT